MRLELTGRQIEITPTIRRLVDRKLAKLERLLNDTAVSAQVVLTRERHRHRADITLHARGEKFLHGCGDNDAWEPSLAAAIEKIVQQAQKVKGKWQERKRHASGHAATAAEEAATNGRVAVATRVTALKRPDEGGRIRMPRILRASRQTVKPMSVADAAREMDAGADGVVVFHDVETSTLSVLYRRQNGELTLVQTET